MTTLTMYDTALALPMFFKCCMFFSTVPGIRSTTTRKLLANKVVMDIFNSLDFLATFSNGIWECDIKLRLPNSRQVEHPNGIGKEWELLPPNLPGLWIITHSSVASFPKYAIMAWFRRRKEVNWGELSMYRLCRVFFCGNDLQGTMVYSQGILLLRLSPRMEFCWSPKTTTMDTGTHKYNSVVYKWLPFSKGSHSGSIFFSFPQGCSFPSILACVSQEVHQIEWSSEDFRFEFRIPTSICHSLQEEFLSVARFARNHKDWIFWNCRDLWRARARSEFR